MKPKRITLLDVGLDELFNTSMQFVDGTVRNVNVGRSSPLAEIDYVRSRELPVVVSAMMGAPDVLHVMAHGDHEIAPTFSSGDGGTNLDLDQLTRYAQNEWGFGIRSAAVIADGCKTGIGLWQKAMHNLLEREITYVGTSRLIDWRESTVYCAAFYSAYLRKRGRGVSAAEHAFDAAERAIEAYGLLMDLPCPFRVMTLKPSRSAIRAFKR